MCSFVDISVYAYVHDYAYAPFVRIHVNMRVCVLPCATVRVCTCAHPVGVYGLCVCVLVSVCARR